jgi:hypothetical protein
MSVIANRVKVTVDSAPGTGTIDLGSAVTGFQSFADGGISDGEVVSYVIEDGNKWEIGTGTYTTGTPNTLSRTVIESSNSDSEIDASASAVVFITALASEMVLTSGAAFTGAVQGSTDTDTSNTGTVTLDFATNQNFVLTLTGNVTLDNPTTEAVGQSGFIVFIQDATGGRTVSLGTDYETAGGAGLTLSSAASATDVVPYIVAASGRILLGTPQLAFS